MDGKEEIEMEIKNKDKVTEVMKVVENRIRMGEEENTEGNKGKSV